MARVAAEAGAIVARGGQADHVRDGGQGVGEAAGGQLERQDHEPLCGQDDAHLGDAHAALQRQQGQHADDEPDGKPSRRME